MQLKLERSIIVAEIVIDSSVWIEYFRGNPDFKEALHHLLQHDAMVTLSIIQAELIQGFHNAKEATYVLSLMQQAKQVSEKTTDWIEAAWTANRLRKKGITVPLSDCYIAYQTQKHGLQLWTIDKHFEQIKTDIKLKLYAATV